MDGLDKVALEKETFSFFTYLKEIFQEADCKHIYLDDLLPDSTKTVAAQAFYHGKFTCFTFKYWCWQQRMLYKSLKQSKK